MRDASDDDDIVAPGNNTIKHNFGTTVPKFNQNSAKNYSFGCGDSPNTMLKSKWDSMNEKTQQAELAKKKSGWSDFHQKTV